MGIKTRLDAYPAEGLGGLTRGVSPLEMANAYATIAAGGWRNQPIAITQGHVPRRARRRPRASRASTARSPTASRTRRRRSSSRTSRAAPASRTRRRSAARPPARPARPTTSPTPGSSASRRTWRPSVWVGHATSRRCRCPASPAARSRRKIWGEYMKQARGKFCGDFTEPKHAVLAQPFFGKYSRGGGGRFDDGNGFNNGAAGPTTPGPGRAGAAATGSPTGNAAAGEHRTAATAQHGRRAAGGTGDGGTAQPAARATRRRCTSPRRSRLPPRHGSPPALRRPSPPAA